MNRHLRTLLIGVTGVIAACATACNDPYSTRRIQRRNEHVNTTLNDFKRHEERGRQRIEEAGKTLDHWWKLDTDRFNQRIITVGDYIW